MSGHWVCDHLRRPTPRQAAKGWVGSRCGRPAVVVFCRHKGAGTAFISRCPAHAAWEVSSSWRDRREDFLACQPEGVEAGFEWDMPLHEWFRAKRVANELKQARMSEDERQHHAWSESATHAMGYPTDAEDAAEQYRNALKPGL